MDYRVLVVDDDPDIREIVKLLLSAEGYQVAEAANGSQAVEMAEEGFDLIILDVMMPGLNGFQTCQKIRQKSIAPILFLTARTEESDKTLGFSAGADDYLVKPFSYGELVSRVKAMIRRYRNYGAAKQTEETILSLGDVQINQSACEVSRGGELIPLTDLEYRLLLLMAQHPKKVFSVQNLYESIWDEPYYYTSSNTVMVHIKNLRRKLTRSGKDADVIHTVWGKGYRIE